MLSRKEVEGEKVKEENRKEQKGGKKAVNKREKVGNRGKRKWRERDRVNREKTDDRCCQRKKCWYKREEVESKSRRRERNRGAWRRKRDTSGIKNRPPGHGSSSTSCHNRGTFPEQGNSNLLNLRLGLNCALSSAYVRGFTGLRCVSLERKKIDRRVDSCRGKRRANNCCFDTVFASWYT